MHGISNWTELSGRVLVVVNSTLARTDEVAGVFARVRERASAPLRIIAPGAWRPWLESQGLINGDVLFALDSAGVELELNYFLEQIDTLHWITSAPPDLILGTAPHSLYNDEIKSVFEQRVALCLGEGRLVAHAWPSPYVYLLNLGDVILRFDRHRREHAYAGSAAALVSALHRQWMASGQPDRADGGVPETDPALTAHLGPLMQFDEDRGEPVDLVSLSSVSEFVSYLERLLHPAAALRDRRIAGLETTAECQRLEIEEQAREIARLNAVVAERNEAVSTRDASIGRLQGELYRLTRGWRKLIVGRPNL